MFIGLKIFGVAVGIYAGVRLAGVSIAWLGQLFDDISPRKVRKDDHRRYYD